MVKRAVRPQQNQSTSPLPTAEGQLGGMIEREGPIHISNVMLLDAKGNAHARAASSATAASACASPRAPGAELD